jgi:hypothetical protein
MERSPLILENGGYEDHTVYRRADHRIPYASTSGHGYLGHLRHSGGFSQPTFYKWLLRCDGMQASDAAKLRDLEAENNKRGGASLNVGRTTTKSGPTPAWAGCHPLISRSNKGFNPMLLQISTLEFWIKHEASDHFHWIGMARVGRSLK